MLDDIHFLLVTFSLLRPGTIRSPFEPICLHPFFAHVHTILLSTHSRKNSFAFLFFFSGTICPMKIETKKPLFRHKAYTSCCMSFPIHKVCSRRIMEGVYTHICFISKTTEVIFMMFCEILASHRGNDDLLFWFVTQCGLAGRY